MIGRVKHAWNWFVGGLTEAMLWGLERGRRGPVHRIEIGVGEAAVLIPDGSRIGTIRENQDDPFDPPQLANRLAGTAIEIAVPSSWILRRDLEPVAPQSLPFLDAFVRHRIERITPWRAADVLYRIRHGVPAGDPLRVAVEVGVVPKRLVGAWIALIERAHPGAMSIVAGDAADTEALSIPLANDSGSRRLRPLRRRVAVSLTVLTIGFAGMIGWLFWQTAQVEGDIEAQDTVMEDRKALLARAQRRQMTAGGVDDKLRQRIESRPRVVDIVEALSAALPDTAFLTKLDLDKDHLTIAGISTDVSALVPSLERSRRFADVAFGAPTTKAETGEGDRFHLDARIPHPGEGASP